MKQIKVDYYAENVTQQHNKANNCNHGQLFRPAVVTSQPRIAAKKLEKPA